MVRVSDEVARHLRAGHPWVYREALGHSAPRRAGEAVVVVDAAGGFVGRGLYDPSSSIAIRLFVRDSASAIDAALVRDRVARARALREALLPADLTALRVLNGEGDGLPGAACDRYGDFLVLQLLTPAWEPLEAALLDALEDTHHPRGLYVQRRYVESVADRPRPGAELARGQAAPLEATAVEAGLTFVVDPTAPLAPGLALELREARALVGARAAGRRVLNVFSYGGGFTLHALRGGAEHVTSIDVTARSHAAARRSLQASGLDESRCAFEVADASAVLARFAARGVRFDLCVLDPPTFAAGKSLPFASARDYAEIVRATAAVLAEGGILAAASNAQRMPQGEFDRACGEGGARAGAALRVLERRALPPDFPTLAALPESSHLKFALLARL
ncbi:MAG: class I SAM-dependent rRNA methyltransferase [Myxococcota bacterium]